MPGPLRELEPQFLKRTPENGKEIHKYVDSVDEADGIIFKCPKCFQANGGMVGTHSVLCWRPGVPDDLDPKPGRWEFEGAGYDDLSLVAGSSSIQLTSGCMWHGFIDKGQWRDA